MPTSDEVQVQIIWISWSILVLVKLALIQCSNEIIGLVFSNLGHVWIIFCILDHEAPICYKFLCSESSLGMDHCCHDNSCVLRCGSTPQMQVVSKFFPFYNYNYHIYIHILSLSLIFRKYSVIRACNGSSGSLILMCQTASSYHHISNRV
jgi:hypothetical protein